jgi:hypothetical protein
MVKYWPLGPPVPVPVINTNNIHTHDPSSVLEIFYSPSDDGAVRETLDARNFLAGTPFAGCC